MVNLLGLDPLEAQPLEERLEQLRELPNAHVHWYGKYPETPGRKLGHVTTLLSASSRQTRQQQAEDALALIRAVWPLKTPQIE